MSKKDRAEDELGWLIVCIVGLGLLVVLWPLVLYRLLESLWARLTG